MSLTNFPKRRKRRFAKARERSLTVSDATIHHDDNGDLNVVYTYAMESAGDKGNSDDGPEGRVV